MKSKKELILSYMVGVAEKTGNEFIGFSTKEISEQFQMQRTNVSAILNEMVRDNIISKSSGRPVLYHLVKENKQQKEKKTAFGKLIGHNGSLQNGIKLAKASIMYPGEGGSINSLIIGDSGTGKSMFAKLMYEYAAEQGAIGEKAPFIKVHCGYYANNEKELLTVLYGDGEGDKANAFKRAADGVLLIDHIELMTPTARRMLYDFVDRQEERNMMLICTTDEKYQHVLSNVALRDKFPIHIVLPSLMERPMEERLELVENFLMNEAEKVNKDIIINSELLRCFLLYYCKNNVKQLKSDIKVGCANAYVRDIDKNLNVLHVYVRDCYPYVRKGFIFYKENRKQIESLIPDNYTYTFTSNRDKRREEALLITESQNTIYDLIEHKVKELRQREIKEEDIMTIVSADLENDLMRVRNRLDASGIDRHLLTKWVDAEIIDLVDKFLKEASKRFNRVYPASTFYSICLHLSSCLQRKVLIQNLSNEKIMEIVEEYKQEYTLSTRFASEVEKRFNVRMSIDEVIYITVFLRDNHVHQDSHQSEPALLVVMHGTIASSIANTINTIYQDQKVYAYDLLLDNDMNAAYEELKNLCKVIDTGGGILIIYDVGSIQTMCESITQETGIPAKLVCVPITAMLLDCAVRISYSGSLEEAYENIMREGEIGGLGSLAKNYQTKEEKSTLIISFCKTGEGSAVQIKQYLEKNMDLDDVSIVTMADNNPKKLLSDITFHQEKKDILCMIGPNDPKIHGIPFVSIKKIFDTPVEKLSMLLALKDVEETANFDYSAVYDYLQENLPYVGISKLKRYLPKTLKKIEECVGGLSIDKEVGLFMHIACSINRTLGGEPFPGNPQKNSVISKHKRLYNDLQDILVILEKGMQVSFDDDELATIIEILI